MGNALLIGLSRQMALGRELDVDRQQHGERHHQWFKARQARFREFLMPGASAEAFQAPDRRCPTYGRRHAARHLGGNVERTGNPLDVAVKGDAFFAVQTPAGERFTRNGAFTINQLGQLVTSDGHPALGDNGPITFSPRKAAPRSPPTGPSPRIRASAASFAWYASPIRRC
jgi:flagellar basal-body rod protein FlgF